MTLVWLAAAFIVGIFTGFSLALNDAPLFVLACVLSLATVFLWRRPQIRFPCLLLVFFLLGMARTETARVHIGHGEVAYYNGNTVSVTGFVNAEPDNRDTGNNYVIAVDHIQLRGRFTPVSGQIELHTAPGQLLDEGDEIQLTGVLATPTNSAAVPYRSILSNRGIYSEMAFPRLFVTGHVSLGLLGIADSIRQWIETQISGVLPEPEATLLIAIIIGARSAQLGNLAPVLIQTGLIHLIAISGIKIAIVAGTVNSFLKRFLSRTPTLFLSVLALGSYWVVSGATVAGLRASIMWLLVFVAAYLGRPTFALASLGIAVSAMLAVSPSLLWDTGFQLTAIGTAAIVAFSPAIERATRRLPSAFAASFSTTLAAQLGVLPVQIVSFHVISPISLLSNAIVLPFIPLTMVVGFLVAILPYPPMVAIAYALSHAVVGIAEWAARLGTAFQLSSVPLPVSLAYYAILLLLAAVVWRLAPVERRHVRGEWLVGLMVAAVGLGFAFSSPTPQNRITFLTNGDALIVSHGQHILIDGGASGSQLLTSLGSALPFPNGRLDVVIDTSPDSKNVASLLEVAQHVSIGEVIDPGIEYSTQTYGRWRDWLANHYVPVEALRAGLVVRGSGVSISVLAPTAVFSNAKDGAGVLMIRFGGERILYLGDADLTEQQNLPFQTSVSANAVISAVPIDSTLQRASGYRHLILPIAGTYLNMGR